MIPIVYEASDTYFLAGLEIHDPAYTVDSIVAAPGPDDDYDARYGQLRTYLIGTVEPSRSNGTQWG